MTERIIDDYAINKRPQTDRELRKRTQRRRIMKRRKRARKRFLTLVVCVLAIMALSKAAIYGFAWAIDIQDVNLPVIEDFDMAAPTPEATNSNEAWALLLVNKDNPLPDGYKPELSLLRNGLEFDRRATTQLNAMLAAAKEQGLSPVVCSAYRSVERQKELFNNQVKAQMAKGFSHEQAQAEASKAVAYPGTSEHNLALSADIVSANYQLLDEKQANTPEAKWLLAHCAEYGFILRYPQDKSHLTGVMFEPWHYRYVGVEAAKKIMESGMCLEEYAGAQLR